MTTHTSNQVSRSTSADAVLGFIVLGLMMAGVIGIWKAFTMTTGSDVMFSILGTVAAFGGVYYILSGRR